MLLTPGGPGPLPNAHSVRGGPGEKGFYTSCTLSTSARPPVGPELGVMLLIAGTAISLHKRKSPGAAREGDTGA